MTSYTPPYKHAYIYEYIYEKKMTANKKNILPASFEISTVDHKAKIKSIYLLMVKSRIIKSLKVNPLKVIVWVHY